MTQEEELIRAERAKQILDDPLIKEFIEKLDAETLYQIDKAPTFGLDIRKKQQQIIMLRQQHNQFVRHFETCIETGMLARDPNLGSR